MNKHVKEFLHRGLTCAAGGPLVLAIIYAILATVALVTYRNSGSYKDEEGFK